MSWPGCGKPALPGADGAELALREVVAELAHAHRLEDVEPEALLPQPEHLVGEVLARAHAVPERGHVGLRERRLLQDLAVDRRHADEDRRAVLGDEARPGLGVVLPLVRDHGLAVVERVHEGRAQHVGPVELARVHDAVALARGRGALVVAVLEEIEPVGGRGRAADQRAVAVQHALGVSRGARGVDEVGRVVDGGVRGRLARAHAGERLLEVEGLHARVLRHLARAGEEREAQALARELGAHRGPRGLVDHDGVRAGIVGEVLDLLGREERGGGHAHRAALHRPEERGRVVDAVGQPDEHALAGRDAQVAQKLREAAGALGELAVGDRARAERVVLDDHRHAVRGRGAQVRVGAGDADVEARGDRPLPGRERGEGRGARVQRMTPYGQFSRTTCAGRRLQDVHREIGVGRGQGVQGVGAQQRLQRLAEHRRVEHLALELDRAAQQRVGLDRRLEDRDPRPGLRRRGREGHLAGMDVRGVDHLLAGKPQGGLLAGVPVDDARLLVAVQVQPAAHVVGLDEVLRHGALADEGLHAADHALARDARLEEDVVQVELELLGPVARRDLDAHRLGEVVDAEHDVLHGRVLHELRGDLERLGVLDDRLDGDPVVQAHEHRGEVADLGGAVGLAGLGEHHGVEALRQVADQGEVLLVLLRAERVDAHGDLHLALPGQVRQLAAQELAAHLLLAAAVLQVEQERVRGRVPRVLLEAGRRLVQVLVDAERGRVLHRRVVDLDAGPVVAQDLGGGGRGGGQGGGQRGVHGNPWLINGVRHLPRSR